MDKDMKKTLAFLFFLLAGILIGSAIAYFTRNIGFLSWLAYTLDFGIPSGTINLQVIRITAGFELEVSVAHVFSIIGAIVAYCKICKSL